MICLNNNKQTLVHIHEMVVCTVHIARIILVVRNVIPVYTLSRKQFSCFDWHSSKRHNFIAKSINCTYVRYSEHHVLLILVDVQFLTKIICLVGSRVCHPSNRVSAGLRVQRRNKPQRLPYSLLSSFESFGCQYPSQCSTSIHWTHLVFKC